MQVQQTILATLSLGPVGISDQLTERPTLLPPSSRTPNPNAKITTNKTLVMATCAATGDLLQPSYPLTPLDKMITGYHNGDAPSFSLWGTYTSVATHSQAGTAANNLWYTAFCFGSGHDVSLEESDLSVMVDASALPSPTFDAIPTGAFVGSGATFPNASGVTGHVVWQSDWLSVGLAHNSASGCGAVAPTLWTGDPFPMATTDVIVNVAPLFGDKALLGEAAKITAVSSYRFSSVRADASGIVADLRGKSGEVVTLLVATKSGGALTCSTQMVTIGAGGTAVANI